MRLRLAGLLGAFVFCSMQPALSQEMKLPKAVAAGQAFSIAEHG